ncbi:hypothetical protein NDU88_005455 [Pleurodeles waltl]|uniref:Uncharacterized protein n=1 Tax=Pleurodeles waltl TaxID=8319 RepID=A0AAV7TX65_PLEWA|nr:hypothetical protein NDU88_005455 [Pleurodeles waltl]
MLLSSFRGSVRVQPVALDSRLTRFPAPGFCGSAQDARDSRREAARNRPPGLQLQDTSQHHSPVTSAHITKHHKLLGVFCWVPQPVDEEQAFERRKSANDKARRCRRAQVSDIQVEDLVLLKKSKPQE